MYSDDIHESRRNRKNRAIADAARKLDAQLTGKAGFGVVPVTLIDVCKAVLELHMVIVAADGE